VFAARHRYDIRANRELLALGTANVAGSFFRSVPVSGSFSRTAVNERAGACTPLANVAAALLVGLTLLFLTPLFRYLPIPALAALIIVAASGLLDLRELRYLWRIKRIDGALALVTFLATLLVGIQEGILVGIAASVVAVMYRISRPNVAVLGHLPGTRSFRDVRHFPEAEPLESILMLRVDASFSFANAELLKDLLLRLTKDAGGDVRAVVVDASSINDLDTTAVAVLLSAEQTLASRGIELYFGGVKEPVLDLIKRSGLYLKVGADHFFLSPHRAVHHILTRWGRSAAYLETVPGAPEPGDDVRS
jgi:SulP family sulfate permease